MVDILGALSGHLTAGDMKPAVAKTLLRQRKDPSSKHLAGNWAAELEPVQGNL